MSEVPPPQLVISNEGEVTAYPATGPSTTVPATAPASTVLYQIQLPSFWMKIHTLRLLQIPLNTSQGGTLPPLPIPGYVTGVIIQNPSSNTASIKIQGQDVPVGATWTWEAVGPNFDLDPTNINFDTGGQPIIVIYEYYTD